MEETPEDHEEISQSFEIREAVWTVLGSWSLHHIAGTAAVTCLTFFFLDCAFPENGEVTQLIKFHLSVIKAFWCPNLFRLHTVICS